MQAIALLKFNKFCFLLFYGFVIFNCAQN